MLILYKRSGAVRSARWAHNPKVDGSNPSFAIAQDSGNREERILETANSNTSKENIYGIFKINKSNKFDLVSLKSIYLIYLDEFDKWIDKRQTTKKYKSSIKNLYRRLFSIEFRTINDLKEIVNTPPNIKYKQLAVRNWIKFLSDYEILPFETTILEWKDKIKVNKRSNIDHYIPSKVKVSNFLDKMNKRNKFAYTCVRLLIDSGCRLTELQEFINTFNEDSIEIIDDIAIYSLFRNSGNKNSFYLFLTRKTYDLFIENKDIMKSQSVHSIKTIIKRHDLIPLKYMRKFNFTLMVESEVNFEFANFIQGRSNWSELTPLGIEQSKILGRRQKEENIEFDIVFVSPAIRTQQTLRYAMFEANRYYLKPNIDLRLQELCQGDWERKDRNKIYSSKEFEEKLEKVWGTSWNLIPGSEIKGESQAMTANRMIDFFEETLALHEGKNIGIFGHGLAIKLLYTVLFNFDRETAYKIPLENTSISQIKVKENERINNLFNCHQHLNMN